MTEAAPRNSSSEADSGVPDKGRAIWVHTLRPVVTLTRYSTWRQLAQD